METPLEPSGARDDERERKRDDSLYPARSCLLSLAAALIALLGGAGAGLAAGLTAAEAAGHGAGVAVGVLTGLGGAAIAFVVVVGALNNLVGGKDR